MTSYKSITSTKTRIFKSAQAEYATSPHAPKREGEQIKGIYLILDDGHKLKIKARPAIIIGRSAEQEHSRPIDVDLSPFNALSHGISRQHAIIQFNQYRGVLLCDKNSSNGTFLNGSLLRPNFFYPLNDEDLVMFGSLCALVKFYHARN